MRKTILISLIAFLFVFGICGLSYAGVTGRCDKCHTMHNSQNGTAEAKDFSGTLTTNAYAHLTKSSCLGCHNGVISGSGAPNVFTSVSGDYLAGGTFHSSIVDGAATDYHKVHNVRDIAWTNDESELSAITPGAEASGYTEPVGSAQLACAGYRGCHGRHNGSLDSDAGIRGFHHGEYAGYRYLQFYDGATHTAIVGKGSSDWEKGGALSSNHNVYYALTDYSDTGVNSISALCGLCHGDFHAGADVYSSGSWIRHPTENLLSAASGWTMASVTVDYQNNPFGFNGSDYTSATTNGAYTTTGARVVCVSCHRAHGTANADILRWDYATMEAGTTGVTTGCLGCHHRQRG